VRSLRDLCGYLFGPPGWRPDGGGETTAAIKARWRETGGSEAPAGQTEVAA
jgi:hypothetical protein